MESLQLSDKKILRFLKLLPEKLFSFAIIFILSSTFLFAQEFNKNATAGFVFLKIPTNSRTAALGEASIALADLNSSSVFVNPAGLGFTRQRQSFSASYSPWFAEIKNYSASYSFNSELGTFASGFILLDYGSMPRTVVGGGQKVYDVVGSFSANSFALNFSYSKMLTDRFSFGIGLKFVQETIDVYKAKNILLDGGVLYYTGLSSLRIAATIQNFGTNAKFINDEFKMPAMLRLGAALEALGNYGSEYRITLSTEALHPSDGDERINLGSEISWQELITFRAGYKFFYDEETYSFGVGINPNLQMPASLDFAFADYGRLGNILRFTLNLGLN